MGDTAVLQESTAPAQPRLPWHLLRYLPKGTQKFESVFRLAGKFGAAYRKVDEHLTDAKNRLLHGSAYGPQPYIHSGNFRYYPDTSADSRPLLEHALETIPCSVRQEMKSNLVKLCFAQVATDVMHRYEDKYHKPHIDDARTHHNQSGGIYEGQEKMVIVAEFYKSSEPKAGERPPAGPMQALMKGWNKSTPFELTERLYHEVGHAFDDLCGKVSASPWFQAAYEQDVKAMKAQSGGDVRSLVSGYYIQDQRPDGDRLRGKREVFAQLWAAQRKNFLVDMATPENLNLQQRFSACDRAIRQFQDGYDIAWARGPATLKSYIEAVHSPDAAGQDVSHFVKTAQDNPHAASAGSKRAPGRYGCLEAARAAPKLAVPDHKAGAALPEF